MREGAVPVKSIAKTGMKTIKRLIGLRALWEGHSLVFFSERTVSLSKTIWSLPLRFRRLQYIYKFLVSNYEKSVAWPAICINHGKSFDTILTKSSIKTSSKSKFSPTALLFQRLRALDLIWLVFRFKTSALFSFTSLIYVYWVHIHVSQRAKQLCLQIGFWERWLDYRPRECWI